MCFVGNEIEIRSVDQAVIVSDRGPVRYGRHFTKSANNPHRTASTSTRRNCIQTIKAISESSESSSGAPVIFWCTKTVAMHQFISSSWLSSSWLFSTWSINVSRQSRAIVCPVDSDWDLFNLDNTTFHLTQYKALHAQHAQSATWIPVPRRESRSLLATVPGHNTKFPQDIQTDCIHKHNIQTQHHTYVVARFCPAPPSFRDLGFQIPLFTLKRFRVLHSAIHHGCALATHNPPEPCNAHVLNPKNHTNR